MTVRQRYAAYTRARKREINTRPATQRGQEEQRIFTAFLNHAKRAYAALKRHTK